MAGSRLIQGQKGESKQVNGRAKGWELEDVGQDVGHNFRVLMTEFDIGDNFWMLIPDAYIKNDGDENGQIRHQHLKVFANTFHHQDPSPTSV